MSTDDNDIVRDLINQFEAASMTDGEILQTPLDIERDAVKYNDLVLQVQAKLSQERGEEVDLQTAYAEVKNAYQKDHPICKLTTNKFDQLTQTVKYLEFHGNIAA